MIKQMINESRPSFAGTVVHTDQFCLCAQGVHFKKVICFSNNRALYRCLNCGLHQIFPYTAGPEPVPRDSACDDTITEKEYYGYFMVFYEIIKSLGISTRDKILDFGAGLCYYAKFLVQLGYENAVSVEINEHLVDFARTRLGLDSVYIHLSDVRNEQFDLIIASQVFEHLYNPIDLLNGELHSLLKKRAYLVFGVPNYGSYNRVLLRQVWSGYSPNEHIWMFDVNTVATLLGQSEKYELVNCIIKHAINSPYNAHVPSTFLKRAYYNTFMRLFEFIGKGEQLIVILRRRS